MNSTWHSERIKHHKFNNKTNHKTILMKTKLLFSVLFALSLNTFSQINSYNINQTIIGPGALTFDLNNDGNNDFSFDIVTISPGVLAARVLTIGLSTILDNSTYSYPDTLNYGDPVSGYFHSGTGVLGTFNNAGQFNGAGNKYLGIKINGSGLDYSGWIKLNCSVNRDTLNIISCGYNTVASDSIYAGQTTIAAINENELKSQDCIHIHPNPFSSLTTLRADHCFHNATLEVYNCFGQTVTLIKNISGQTIILPRNNLENGLYFVRLTQDNQKITTNKIIITD
jgi:hypothetical protein